MVIGLGGHTRQLIFNVELRDLEIEAHSVSESHGLGVPAINLRSVAFLTPLVVASGGEGSFGFCTVTRFTGTRRQVRLLA